MTPIETCMRKVEAAARITDSTVVQHVMAALDELEDAYASCHERTLALEALRTSFGQRRAHVCGGPFHRFLCTCIEKRQEHALRPHR